MYHLPKPVSFALYHLPTVPFSLILYLPDLVSLTRLNYILVSRSKVSSCMTVIESIWNNFETELERLHFVKLRPCTVRFSIWLFVKNYFKNDQARWHSSLCPDLQFPVVFRATVVSPFKGCSWCVNWMGEFRSDVQGIRSKPQKNWQLVYTYYNFFSI